MPPFKGSVYNKRILSENEIAERRRRVKEAHKLYRDRNRIAINVKHRETRQKRVARRKQESTQEAQIDKEQRDAEQRGTEQRGTEQRDTEQRDNRCY